MTDISKLPKWAQVTMKALEEKAEYYEKLYQDLLSEKTGVEKAEYICQANGEGFHLESSKIQPDTQLLVPDGHRMKLIGLLSPGDGVFIVRSSLRRG